QRRFGELALALHLDAMELEVAPEPGDHRELVDRARRARLVAQIAPMAGDELARQRPVAVERRAVAAPAFLDHLEADLLTTSRGCSQRSRSLAGERVECLVQLTGAHPGDFAPEAAAPAGAAGFAARRRLQPPRAAPARAPRRPSGGRTRACSRRSEADRVPCRSASIRPGAEPRGRCGAR